MPKLPDYTAVGAAPSGRSGRAMVSKGEVDASAIGKGLQKVGDVITNIATAEKKKMDADDVSKADALLKEGTSRFERAFDKDTKYDDYGKTYETGSTAIRKEAAGVIRDPRLRKRFEEKYGTWHALRRDDMIQRGTRKKDTEFKRSFSERIGNRIAPIQTGEVKDEEIPGIIADVDANIELGVQNGIFSPEEGTALKRKYLGAIQGANTQRILGQANALLKSKNPEEVKQGAEIIERMKRQLEELNKVKPQAETIAPGGVKIDGKGIAAFGNIPVKVMISPSAPYMGRKRNLEQLKGGQIIVHGGKDVPVEDLVKYGQAVDPSRATKSGKPADYGYHFYIDTDGTVIQGAPLDRVVNGALNRNRRQVHVLIKGADEGREPTPEQVKAAKAVISGLGTTLGISNKQVFGHGEVQSNRSTKEGGRVAIELRDKGYVSEWTPTVEGDVQPQMSPEFEEGKKMFGAMSVETRMKLMNNLRRQSKVADSDHRHALKRVLDSNRESLRKYGVEVPEARKAAEALGKLSRTTNWLAKYREGVWRDKTYFETTKDWAETPLGEINDRIEALVPAPGDKDSAPKNKLVEELVAARKQLEAERSEDPAAAADKTAIVEAYSGRTQAPAAQALVPGTIVTTGEVDDTQLPTAIDIASFEDKDGLIEARLEAQAELGIEKNSRRTVTKAEAKAMIPSIKGLDEAAAIKALEAAATRIGEQYGEYARDVFRDALVLTRTAGLTKDDSPAAVVMAKILRGDIPTRQEVSLMEAYKQIEMEDSYLAETTLGRFGLPGMSPSVYQPDTPAISPTVQAPPNQAQLDWALEDPETRGSLFDEMFGPGAFNAAVQYREQEKAE